MFNFVDFGDPSGLSLGALGTPGDTQNRTNLKKLEIARGGGQEGALEAPRMDFGAHFGSLFDIIQQLSTRHGVRRTWKEQGRSAVAMKQRRTKN